MQNPRTRAILLFVLALTFGVLIFGGYLINRQKPPIPDRVVTEAGDVLFTGQDIMAGQQFYFSRGGQHIGTIWGHGSYLAPDWSADFLHRMGLYLAARHQGLGPDEARYFSQEAFDDLPAPERARLTALVTEEIKTNRYDAGDGTLTLTAFQAEAFQALTAYYSALFTSGNEAMGLQSGIVRSEAEGLGLTRFFFWQLLLIAGMLIWLVLVARAIAPALKSEDDRGGLTHMLLYSAVSIPLFYMAGLMYGHGSHLSNAEYWRWWVVHLWVEGFFEVFATVVMAFLLSYIGAVSRRFALITIYFTVFLYLGSGVIGTFHHLYWSGSPTAVIALGAVFSALEVVPLTLLGFEIVHNLSITEAGGPTYAYRWPVYFFISVAFWNLVGAGVFGFLINPPIVLYYAQGINTTPIHSHTALFGVYGMLAISLLLFAVRHIVTRASWSDRLLKWSFWGLNGGLASMALFSLIPSGFYQFYYAVKYGLWFARSPEIASGPVIRALSWARMVPDIIFAVGAISLLLFLVRAIRMSFFTKAAAIPER